MRLGLGRMRFVEVALADEQLGAEGAMRRAIRDIGRGAETATGATFTLDTIS